MKKSLRLTIVALVLAISDLLVQAQDYYYYAYKGTITITQYTGPGGARTRLFISPSPAGQGFWQR